MLEWIKQGKVDFGDTDSSVPTIKAYLKNRELSVPYSIFYKDGRAASKRMAQLIGAKVFENPKDEDVLKRFIQFATFDSNAIILDFFSGSASTAHAVMQLNAEDGGKRKYVMVQLPEPCPEDSAAAKAGYANICEIGKERIRRAGEKIKAEIEAANAQPTSDGSAKPVPDIGFRVLKVDDTNMKEVYYGAADIRQEDLLNYVSNIKEDRTELDLLFQCLLDWHLPLALKHATEEIDGLTVHTYAYPAGDVHDRPELMACFSPQMTEKVVREIAKRHPVGVVFRDACFAGSPAKINVSEIFKTLSPDTTIKVL
jgi:adenine-specific DNA-methyltransferase